MTLEDDVESMLSDHSEGGGSMFKFKAGGLQQLGGGDSTYRAMEDS